MLVSILALVSLPQAQQATRAVMAPASSPSDDPTNARKPATLPMPRRLVGHWAANFPPIVEPCRGKYADDHKWSLFITKREVQSWEETAWPTHIRETSPGHFVIAFYGEGGDVPFTYRQNFSLSDGGRTLTTDQPLRHSGSKERRYRLCPK